MLTLDEIVVRRTKYACCSLAQLHKAVLAWDTGKTKCGDEHFALSEYLKFAARIMANVPVDDTESGCETVEFASEIADYADCICNVCDCPQPAVDCTLVADFTVLDAIAYADLPLSPDEGDAYYILSGTPVGQILTSISAVWVPTLVPPNSIVWSVDDNTYYTNTVYFSPPGPGLLFSTPILTLVSGTTWNLTLSDPQTATNRTIQLQALGPNGWYAIAPATTEDALPQSVNLLGLPVQNIRLNYQLQDELCWYYSGTGEFIPPVVPPDPCTNIPSYGVLAAVDASAQGTLPTGAYLIASDDFSMGNTWASHVNEIVNEDGSFTALTTTDIVYAQDTGIYWRFIAGGMAHLFPAMRVTQTLVPSGYFLESDWISASAAGTRFVMVEARNGPDLVNDWIIAWMGYEYDLPQQIVDLGEFLGLRTTYTVNGCTYVIPGTVIIPDIFTVDLDCTEIVYMTYRYTSSNPPNTQQSFLFTASQAIPGTTVTVTFIAGQMDPADVIRGYDGVDNGGTPIPALTGTFANLQGVTGTSTGPSLYFEVDATQNQPPELATWIFQAVCTQGAVSPDGFALVTDTCETYTFSIDVEILYTGDEPTCGIEYTVDGVAQTPITGLVDFDIETLGPFPYNAEVGITLTHATNPLSNVLLGYFTNNGDCPVTSDPCLPEGAFKLNEIGDQADMPVPAPDGWAYLVVSNFSAIDPSLVGELMTWDNGTMQYNTTPYQPGLFYTQTPFQYWQSNGPGIQPYPLYPVPHMRPTGVSPNNWRIVVPDIINYSIPLNTPLALEVRSGFGPWTQVLTVTLQQLIVLYYFPITAPFTEARIVWDYDTCGVIGGVIIET